MFLRMVAKLIAVLVCHIINLSIEKCICRHAWKVISLSKDPAAPLACVHKFVNSERKGDAENYF